MAKKKSEINHTHENESKIFEIKSEVTVLLKPKEWAMTENLNPILFEAWKDMGPIDKEEFDKIKTQVI